MVNEQILQIKDKNIFIKIKDKFFIFKWVGYVSQMDESNFGIRFEISS